MEFIWLIVTSLLLVLHHSSAHADYQQGRKILKGNMVVASLENISPAKMGLVHHDFHVAVDGRQGLGGRKMLAKNVLGMSEKGLNGASSPKKIPETSMESLSDQQHQWKPQKGQVSEEKTRNLSKKDKRGTQPEEETDAEVMNLMRKDYRQKNLPRRKPPINNHQLHH